MGGTQIIRQTASAEYARIHERLSAIGVPADYPGGAKARDTPRSQNLPACRFWLLASDFNDSMRVDGLHISAVRAGCRNRKR